jgi:hypothetical protein
VEIHNFLSDVLISVRNLFDNYIFPNTLIQSYSFNVSNKVFELDRWKYKSNYKFPAAIITLNEESYTFGERPNVISHVSVSNFNMQKALVNLTTKKVVYLQEEHISIPISCQINCQNQLEAKDIEFTIKNFLPLGKEIIIYDFTSFLEINDIIFTKLDFDINNHEILNLFNKVNDRTGKLSFFFSMNYKPIIKLESCAVNIADKTSKSFSVNLEITLRVQLPKWMSWDEEYIIDRININFLKIGHEPISSFPLIELFDTNIHKKNNIKVLKQIIINNINEHNIKEEDKNIIFDLKIHPDDFILNEFYTYNFFTTLGKMLYNVKYDSFNKQENLVSFKFKENGFFKYLNPSLSTPIIVQICSQRA